MELQCNGCKLFITNNKSYLMCCECKHSYHIECAGKRSEKLDKLSEIEKCAWKCKACAQSDSVSTEKVPKDSIMQPESQIMQFEAFEKLNLEQKLNVQFQMILQIQNQLAMVPQLQEKIQQLDNDNKKIVQQNAFLHRQNQELQDRVGDLEQRSRIKNLEISGIPEIPGENPTDIALNIFRLIGIELTATVIEACHRVPTRNPRKSKPIIVALNSRQLKNNILNTYRTKFKASKITVSNLYPTINDDKIIFLYDHLTVKNKNLLYESKKFAKDNNYKFTWVRDCKLFLRKNENSPIISISSMSDIEKLT
uniref:FP protein C-terminal domain-containing protein n=1 Tax=Photinus pyralis TaxID=7054 RepID=A0A1Y1KQY7_PHOPY